MDDLKAAVGTQVAETVRELDALGERLLSVHASLPVSPREDVMLAGEEEPDFACEVRSAIECGLNDHLKPLVQMLRAVADKGL
jgi:hypothetical protein